MISSIPFHKIKLNKYKWLSLANFSTFAIAIVFCTLMFSAESKGWAIRQLMKVGLFQPSINENISAGSETPPSLLFKDGTGKITDVSGLKGKVVFINFWATWCPPCIAEMPSIQRLYEQYKGNDKVLFLMVDIDSDHAKAQKFMNKKRLDLPVFIPAGPIPSNMLGSSIPVTVVLDKSGKMAFRHEGGADYDNKKFRDAIQRLTEE